MYIRVIHIGYLSAAINNVYVEDICACAPGLSHLGPNYARVRIFNMHLDTSTAPRTRPNRSSSAAHYRGDLFMNMRA